MSAGYGGAYAIKLVGRVRLRRGCRLFNLISEITGPPADLIRKVGDYFGCLLRGGLPGLGAGEEQAAARLAEPGMGCLSTSASE